MKNYINLLTGIAMLLVLFLLFGIVVSKKIKNWQTLTGKTKVNGRRSKA